MSAVDTLLAYKFIRLLTKDFTEWDAYKLGIIDENGKLVKAPKTAEEKSAYSLFHKLVKNIKAIILTAPLGRAKITTIAIALRLLKEETGGDFTEILLKEFPEIEPIPLEESSSVISHGKYIVDDYVLTARGNMIPESNILGVNIYALKDIITGELVYVSEDQLKVSK